MKTVCVLYWSSCYERAAGVVGVYETQDQAEAVKQSQCVQARNVYKIYCIKECILQLAAPDDDNNTLPTLLRRQAE